MAVPTRGLRDIRTISGNVEQVVVPYRAYMQISCLEMEKARRGQEKHSALRRLATLDARLAEIEVEKDALMQALGERGLPAGAPAAKARPTPAGRKSARGLALKY